MMHLRGGEHSLGRVHLEESMEIFRKLEDRHWIVTCLVFLGFIDCEEGDYAAARSRLVETNELLPMAQFPWSTAVMLEGFARVATGEGRATRALRLAGATDTLRRTYGVSIGPIGDADYVRSLEPAWQALARRGGQGSLGRGPGDDTGRGPRLRPGGAGDETIDIIEAVDGEVDNIDCGPGSDAINSDAGIDVVAGNC